ncbi:hypothetical protein ALC60_11344 [Trachymyrmex zeteki]|uniref:Uncharacterized protein n=1 Tax=Mycetomoellerius zeteki TaxID=64791 RepID=A0A151WP04_9HYME|nr:hypothetical protein ALC60_11344 [Trachymyrmex zeteki]
MPIPDLDHETSARNKDIQMMENVNLKLKTQYFLSDTDGKRKVGPQVPSETATGPVEEAEAESTQEVRRKLRTLNIILAFYASILMKTRYGPRPASETANRPITLGYGSGNGGGYGSGNGGGYGYVVNGYGGYGRPAGHGGSISTYGISGTLADGDEFGPNDASYPDASTPQGNIQAQKVELYLFIKAIALKALAGVALIGAAAALASNPVLLPISFVADGSSSKLVISPRCVARLTCEIQKDYLSDVGKDVEILSTNRRFHLTNLYANFLNIEVLRDTKLID